MNYDRDRLITVREAANRLGVREGTIRLWLVQRRLPVVRCGRAVRIPMARKRYQKGCVILRGDVWYGRYREDVIRQDGKVTRVLRNTVLGSKKEYPTKRLAERKLELLLHRINAPEYRPGRVATVVEFAERWEFEILSKRKPSTREAAKSHLAAHILPFISLGWMRSTSRINRRL